MPKSKRNKQVDLSKTKKHGFEGKKKLFEEIRSCIETYTHLFIFSVNDMRNSKIKSVREQWKHSRFFIGKNKVMAKALGMNPEDEFRMNLHKIGRRLKGERGLLFSNQSIEEVLKWFSSYSEGDFARSGNRATETILLKEGPLSQFPHNLEPYLRQLGLPTALQKGIIHLVQDHTVCNVGEVLTPETAKIVKLLGYEMAEFYVKIECVWSQDGSFSDLASVEESKENLFQTNSTSESKQVSSDIASMDVDGEEITEPSDEMIENIIMKNRKSLMDKKFQQPEKEASSDESSDNDEMADLPELKTTDKNILLSLSPNKVKNDEPQIDNVNVPKKDTSEVISTNEISSESIKDTSIVNIEQYSESVESSKLTSNEVDDKNDMGEEMLAEDSKTIANDADKEEHKTAEDVSDVDESEEEEIPDLVGDNNDISEQSTVEDKSVNKNEVDEQLKDTMQNADGPNESIPTNENSLKRLSLDKSVLQSPVMLEKRPKFSPKMTRSAMKAKKAVSKIDTNKVNDNSDAEVKEEKKSSRGRAEKREPTGLSPAERQLRNRSIKIVKKT